MTKQPPSPEVMFFIPSKLKQVISPKLPIRLFLKFVPNALAASSITLKLFFFAKINNSVSFPTDPE